MQLTFYRSSFRSNITNQLKYSWALARYILGVSAFRDFIHRFYLWIEYEPKNKGTCKLDLSTMCCTIILRIDGDAKILLHRCAQMIHVTTAHLSLRLFYLQDQNLVYKIHCLLFSFNLRVRFLLIFFGGGGRGGAKRTPIPSNPRGQEIQIPNSPFTSATRLCMLYMFL